MTELKKQDDRFTIIHHGVPVHCRISPCSWMYPGYGLQVGMSLTHNGVNCETVFILDKAVKCCDVPLPVDTALTFATRWLDENGIKPLQNAWDKWNLARIEFAKIQAAEAIVAAQRMATKKAEGFKYCVVAWVHPRAGDDHQVEAYYVKKPLKADLTALLQSSFVKDDYTITPL